MEWVVRAGEAKAPDLMKGSEEAAMKRIHVDFNTLNSAPEDLVKFPRDGSVPPLAEGERVVLYDADGLEVEAKVVSYITPWGEHRFMAKPDGETWHDTIPQDTAVSTAPSAE